MACEKCGRLENERNYLRSMLKEVRAVHRWWGQFKPRDENIMREAWQRMDAVLKKPHPYGSGKKF